MAIQMVNDRSVQIPIVRSALWAIVSSYGPSLVAIVKSSGAAAETDRRNTGEKIYGGFIMCLTSQTGGVFNP